MGLTGNVLRAICTDSRGTKVGFAKLVLELRPHANQHFRGDNAAVELSLECPRSAAAAPSDSPSRYTHLATASGSIDTSRKPDALGFGGKFDCSGSRGKARASVDFLGTFAVWFAVNANHFSPCLLVDLQILKQKELMQELLLRGVNTEKKDKGEFSSFSR